MKSARYCGRCNSPVFLARDGDRLVVVDRQEAADGEFSLTESDGVLSLVRCPGWGPRRYRQHTCLMKARPTLEVFPGETELEAAIRVAEGITKPRTKGARVISALLAELKRLQLKSQERDAVDDLIATCAGYRLPKAVQAKIKVVCESRKAYYM